MVDPTIIETAKQYISLIPKELELRKAYLFGSRARGSSHEDSDIDLALVLGNMEDFFSTQMLLMRLRRQVDLRIEPHPIDENDFNSLNPLAFEVSIHGFELVF